MTENHETDPGENPNPSTLVHSDHVHKEASGGWIEYDIYTEYHHDPKTNRVIKRVFSSCENTRKRSNGWERRLDSTKEMTLKELPEIVREKIRQLGITIK